MPRTLLNVSHVLQTADSDCLVACAMMVLAHLGYPAEYEQIAKLLRTRPFGTPARHIAHLEQLGFKVILTEMPPDEIKTQIQGEHPVIVFVHTADLPYWDEATQHAVVIIGFDDAHFYLNDPFFSESPQKITDDALALAQLEFDHLCAVIQRP